MRRFGFFCFLLVTVVSLVAVGCGGGGGDDNPLGPGGTGDFFSYSIDGGPEQTFTEPSSCSPPGDCDPFIFSMAGSIIMEANYNGDDFDEILTFMIGGSTTGTYTIWDTTQVSYMHNGTSYIANRIYPSSGGTIIITRHDEDRIEGTFDVTLVDGGENTIDLAGSFGLEPGYMP